MTTYADRIPGYIVQIPDDPRTNRDPNRCVDYYILDTASKLLYIWPERLHQRRPTQAEIDEAKGKSNNQFRKLMEKYNKTNIKVGVYVDFEVVDDRLRTVKNVEVRGNNPGQYHCRNSEDVLKTVCVVKPGVPRLCYSLDYSDPVEADADLLQQLLPDVPFNAFLTYRLDFERLEAHPRLHEVDRNKTVAVNKLPDLQHELPWHRVVYQLEDVLFADEFEELNIVQPNEAERFLEAIAKEHEPTERIDTFGFFTELGQVYCKIAMKWPVVLPWTPHDYRDLQWAGRLVNFKAYFCRHNKCYVIYEWHEKGLPIDVQQAADADGTSVTTFKAGLLATGFCGVYWNRYLGFVRDSKQLLDCVETTLLGPTWVYVRQTALHALYKFDVEAIATECYANGNIPSRTINPFVGEAVVIGARGELLAKDLYEHRFFVSEALRTQHGVELGHTVFVRAVPNPDSGVYEVTDLELLNEDRIHYKRNEDFSVVKFKVQARVLAEHVQFLWTDKFGPVFSPDRKIPGAARFRNCEPTVFVVDKYDEGGVNGCRFVVDTADVVSFRAA